jgi:alkaline phosphatase D
MNKSSRSTASLAALLGAVVLTLIVAACAEGDGDGGAGAPSCASSEPAITHGPRVGAVSDTEAKVWARACRPVSVAVEYKSTDEDWRAAQPTEPVQADAARDGIAVARLTGLDADTRYDYRLLIDGEQAEPPLTGSFATMPAAGGGTLTFMVGSDLHPASGQQLTVFDLLAQQPATFALLFGDLVDIEPLVAEVSSEAPPAEATATPPTPAPRPNPQSKDAYESLYRAVLGDTHFRAFMASMPTVMMWDDHEILNDWDGGTSHPYPFARAAFDEYAAAANPDPVRGSDLYYAFRASDADFFVLDTRTFRDREDKIDNEQKTMLGNRQKADLKRWLLGSTAKIKFIISSVMWGNLAAHKEEAWINYRTERDEILDFIRDQDVKGVVLLSSDEHWNAVAHIPPWGHYEVAASSLGGVPFLQTFTAEPELVFKLGRTHAFGLYTVDTRTCPATVDFRITGTDGDLVHEMRLNEAELSALYDETPDGAAYCQAIADGTADSDGDGCSDAQERGNDETLGGRRDATNRWDFFDGTRDGAVTFADVQALIGKLGAAAGNEDYDPVYDRSAPAEGADAWALGPPDGVIGVDDLFSMVAQMGHSCTAGQR